MTAPTAPNDGLISPPEPQGYDLQHVRPNGTEVWACDLCGAIWNADDLHMEDCERAEIVVRVTKR